MPGACQTILNLADEDFISVLAVDSSPHAIVDMSRIGPNRDQMLRSVSLHPVHGRRHLRGGRAQGRMGGTAKNTGGNQAPDPFSDADDSEEPDDYKTTLSEMTRAGATVSVIALGTEKAKTPTCSRK